MESKIEMGRTPSLIFWLAIRWSTVCRVENQRVGFAARPRLKGRFTASAPSQKNAPELFGGEGSSGAKRQSCHYSI